MTLLLVTLLAAAMMAGLSWFISVVHYPLFARVGEATWPGYHDAHRSRTAFVVIPPMVAELGGSALIVLDRPAGVGAAVAVAGLALAAATWLVTFALSVPDHERLAAGYDAAVGRRLTRGHHLRTLLWSAHAVLLCTMVAAAA
ncbi:MAG: hypothetical protein JWO90_1735 [Solirubrobacterales bacterium]|jgi:hypothetical protein|nr:hypothetical protein [Solirubrobacterales bacterium]